MHDAATHVIDLSVSPPRSRSLAPGASLDIGRHPDDERHLLAVNATLPTVLRLVATNRGVALDVGSQTEGVWCFALAPGAPADPRPALRDVTFDHLRASLLAADAAGALTRFIRTDTALLRVPESLGRFTHHTGPRFDAPRPPLDALPALTTRATLFLRGHAFDVDPPVPPPPLTGADPAARPAARPESLRAALARGPRVAAPERLSWIVRDPASGAARLLDTPEAVRAWLDAAPPNALALRRAPDGSLDPHELAALDGARALRPLLATTAPAPDGAWPGWREAPASLAVPPCIDAIAEAIARWREFFTPGFVSAFSPASTLLDLVDDALPEATPAARVAAWVEAARLAPSPEAMTLASLLWTAACVMGSKHDALDAAQVALLVGATLHLLTDGSAPAIPGNHWVTLRLGALAEGLGAKLPKGTAAALELDAAQTLAAFDGNNHRLRTTSAHAIVYATAVPSRAEGDGRRFFLRPAVSVVIPAAGVRALEAMARERRYLASSKVSPILKRWSHRGAALDDALAAFAVHADAATPRHLARAAAWLRASPEHPVEGFARVLDARAR
ncbi:MAG: hypothetical protein U0324_43670 [Polyangiales bacterium]